MRSLRTIVQRLAIAALLLPVGAHAQMSPEQFARVLDFSKPTRTLGEWDEALDVLNRLAWRGYESPPAVIEEVGGQPYSDYWNRYVLLPAAKDRLDALRARAKQYADAGDQAALTHVIEEASPLIAQEKYHVVLMITFVNALTSLSYHKKTLEPWLARASEEERKTAAAHVASGLQSFTQALEDLVKATTPEFAAPRRFLPAANPSIRMLNAQRRQLVDQQVGLPDPYRIQEQSRTAPCPAPSEPQSGSGKPALREGFPSSDAYYPLFAKSADMQGSVTVKVSVSETGCAEKAAVSGTSGVPALDEAALRLALDGVYTPASVEGKAIRADLFFRVKFALIQ